MTVRAPATDRSVLIPDQVGDGVCEICGSDVSTFFPRAPRGMNLLFLPFVSSCLRGEMFLGDHTGSPLRSVSGDSPLRDLRG